MLDSLFAKTFMFWCRSASLRNIYNICIF